MSNRDGSTLSPEDENAIHRMEDDMNAWCPSSGENRGRMIESPGSDEWYITCPTCGARWSGSTVLPDHSRP